MANYGGMFKSTNAPNFQADPASNSTRQLFNLNIKDIKLQKIGMIELLSQVGILNRLLKAGGIMPGRWEGQGAITMVFRDSRPSTQFFGGFAPRKMINTSQYVRGYLRNYAELYGSCCINYTDIKRQTPFNTKIAFVDAIKGEMKGLVQSQKIGLSRSLVTGPSLSKIINSADVVEAADKPAIQGYQIKNASMATTGSDKKYAEFFVYNINQFTAHQVMCASKSNKRRLVKIVGKGWMDRDAVPHKVGTLFPATAVGRSKAKAILRKSFPTAGIIRVVGITAAGDEEDLAGADTGYTDLYIPSTNNMSAGASAAPTTDGFYSMLDWLDLSNTKRLFDLNRRDYPYMMAHNFDGGDIGAGANDPDFFDILYNAGTMLGAHDASNKMMEYICGPIYYSHALRLLESEKGGYKVAPTTTDVTKFDWQSIYVQSPRGGRMKITAFNEWPEDKVGIIDWSCWKFLTDGLFKVVKSPDGNEWYTVRNDASNGKSGGYQFICDTATYGQLACAEPWKQGLITNLPRPIIGRGGKTLSKYTGSQF